LKTEDKKLKIGIFGATFDPPHSAHLIAAEYAVSELKLNKVLMIPANVNPLKKQRKPTPPDIRLQMIQAAVNGYPQFEVNDVELKRGGVSYMIDTVLDLRENYPPAEAELYLLLGADAAEEFHLWRSHRQLAEICRLVVFNRPQYNLQTILKKLTVPALPLNIPAFDISSTAIRRRIREGKPVDFLAPVEVLKIIQKENLYR